MLPPQTWKRSADGSLARVVATPPSPGIGSDRRKATQVGAVDMALVAGTSGGMPWPRPTAARGSPTDPVVILSTSHLVAMTRASRSRATSTTSRHPGQQPQLQAGTTASRSVDYDDLPTTTPRGPPPAAWTSPASASPPRRATAVTAAVGMPRQSSPASRGEILLRQARDRAASAAVAAAAAAAATTLHATSAAGGARLQRQPALEGRREVALLPPLPHAAPPVMSDVPYPRSAALGQATAARGRLQLQEQTTPSAGASLTGGRQLAMETLAASLGASASRGRKWAGTVPAGYEAARDAV